MNSSFIGICDLRGYLIETLIQFIFNLVFMVPILGYPIVYSDPSKKGILNAAMVLQYSRVHPG